MSLLGDHMQSLDEQDILGRAAVSRETLDDLRCFSLDLTKWSRSINLVAPSTVVDLWKRHILDGVQIYELAPKGAVSWCDIGSGGGLPGIVVAILLKHAAQDSRISLIESDARKAAFLKLVARTYSLNATIVRSRIETATAEDADVVTARALAPLDRLLGYVARHLKPTGVALLPKGRNFQQEVEQAQRSWHFKLEVERSYIDADSRILKISEIEPKVGPQ